MRTDDSKNKRSDLGRAGRFVDVVRSTDNLTLLNGCELDGSYKDIYPPEIELQK